MSETTVGGPQSAPTRPAAPSDVPTPPADWVEGAAPAPGDEHMWTARLRGAAMRALPPGKLLPDRQPSYVASWVYVFGILSFA